jgi:hypothetical protein
MKEKYNTSELSDERIYKRRTFLVFNFNNKNPLATNAELLKFITAATIKAADDKYVEWGIYPSHDDPTEDDPITRYHLFAEGLELETDAEYRIRLYWKIRHLKQSRENWEKQKKYFDFGEDSVKLQKYEEIIETLKK